MKAKANAIFISSIYNQEVGDTNWNEYQTIITANSVNELTIRTSDTTANNLSVTSNYSSLVPGSKIYVSNNGTTLIGGTIGTITTGTVKSNTSTKAVDTTRSAVSGNTIYNTAASTYASANFIKPDGKLFWICGGDGVIREYKLNVPWNLASGASTGKTIGAYNGNIGTSAFCFSYDGKYFFRSTSQDNNVASPAAECIARFTLITPWDISTLGTNVQSRVMMSGSGGNGYQYSRSMRISRDGKTILTWSYDGTTAGSKNVLAVPFDITSYVSASSYTYSPTGVSGPASYEVSEDGKIWYSWTGVNGAYAAILYQGSFSSPWELNTMAVAKTISLSFPSGAYGDLKSTYGPVGIMSADGKTTGVILPTATPSSVGIVTFNLDTQGGDAAQSYNIDVTSFGMTAAANRAWLSEPSVYVAATRSANTARTWSYQIELDTDTAANTTTAVVGIDGTGVLAANDTVLLNGSTSVTLTSVVETANGLPWKDPAGSTDYIKYFGKNYQTLNSTSITDYTLVANMHMRFSNNGSYFYIIGDSTAVYGTGVYQYVMTSPWDVSTAKFLNFCPIGKWNAGSSNGYYNGSYPLITGFDIDPNGNRFFIFWGTAYANTRAYQYNLSKPHDLNSISSVNGPYTYVPADVGVSTRRIAGTRFNKTGTQILAINTASSGGPSYSQVLTLGTPWDISSVTNWTPVTTLTGTATGMPWIDSCFTPNGDNLLCLGQSYTDSYLTMQPTTTANNSWTGWIWNTKSTSAANVAAYPAGSISATGQSRSIDISPDGTNLYILLASGAIYQFGTRLKPLTKYVITYPTQASAPTSVYLPDPSVLQTFTPSLDSANSTLNFSSSFVSANSRAIQFKINNAPVDTEVTQVRINLNKSQ
jgi:hypothetical protein